MFSKRTGWNLEPNALARDLEDRRARGLPVLDLTESNPTRAGLGLDPAVLRAAIAPDGVQRYEPEPRGMASARDAVCGYYRERGIPIARDEVVLAASSSEAYSWIFKLLCDPGDAVLVPHPGYPLFDYLAELESVDVHPYACRWDGSAWRIDLPELEASITSRTRAIVVVNPSNPTGAFLRPAELAALSDLAATRGIAIVADEVFGDYGFERNRDERVESLADGPAQTLTFVLSGFSKVLALPQLKLGWTVVRGPGATEALARIEVIADTYLSVATPVQLAAPALLARRKEIQAAIGARVATNLRALRDTLTADSPVSLLEPEGGWSAVVRVPRLQEDAAWAAELLREEGVLVQPGYFFDFEGPGHLVLSLLPEADQFSRGVAALAAFVASRSG